MGLTLEEQETTINIMRDSDIARIYTSDNTMMTRLDKLVENEKAPHWKLVKEHYVNGEVIGKTYETLKRLVSFRSDIVTREMTEEEKLQAGIRLKAALNRKRKNVESSE